MKTYETLAKLKELYPEDIARIEADEKRVSDLLTKQDYATLEVTQELLALCRKDILVARRMLATNRTMSEQAHAECWHIIDAREWVLRMVAKDFSAELEQIDRELESWLTH